MKKIFLGQTMGVLANLGVLAGIIFMGLELRQNNQLLQAEAIGALLETRINRSAELARNQGVAALLAKNTRKEALTDDEMLRLTQFHTRVFLGFEKTYFLYQEGVIGEEYMRTNLPIMKRAFNEKGVSQSPSQTWESFKMVAPPAYIGFIEQCVHSDCEDIPR
jgi:hypothetical protein